MVEEQHRRFWDMLCQRAIQTLAFLQFEHGQLSLGNIEYHTLPADRNAVGVLDKAASVANPEYRPVFADDTVFIIDTFTGGHRVSGAGKYPIAIIRMYHPGPDITVAHPIFVGITKLLDRFTDVDRRVR